LNLVSFNEHDSHSRIVMDDGKANAISFEMAAALNEALDHAENAQKPVVIAGRPGKFSAGFDLTVMSSGAERARDLLHEGAKISKRLSHFPTPVLLAVTGHALAMGALMVLSADYRIGVKGNFKIGLNEVAIKMTLPWFGVELARARLSKRHFNAAVNLAQIYDPDGAVDAGYLDEAIEEAAFETRVDGVIHNFQTLDPESFRQTRDRVRSEFFEQFEKAMALDFG